MVDIAEPMRIKEGFSSREEAIDAARKLGREMLSIKIERAETAEPHWAVIEVSAADLVEFLEISSERWTNAESPKRPSAKLAAAMLQEPEGERWFKTKRELFDALEAAEDG